MANEVKKEDSIEDKIANAIGKALPAAVEAMIRVQSEGAAQAKAKAIADATALIAARPVEGNCPDCRQVRRACKGQHRQAILFPKSGRFVKSFEGLCLNGIWYRSNNRGHRVLVPAEWDAENMLANWESQEEQLRSGRESFHNAGELGGKNSRVNPPAQVDLG